MAGTTPQFADLTTVPTQAQVLAQEVLPQLASAGVNVTSWPIGGVYRALAQVVAFGRQSARLMIAAFTAAGFEDYVFGRTPAPGGLDVTGWAPLVAKQRYGLTQKPATYTQRTILLTNSTATPYNNLQPGGIFLTFPSGNRYVLQGTTTQLIAAMGAGDTTASVVSTIGYPTAGTLTIDLEQVSYTGITATSFTGLTRGANGTTAAAHTLAALVGQVLNIPANGSLTTTFRSEFQMAIGLSYNGDPTGASPITFATSSFPGVTATNFGPVIPTVSQVGSGLGSLTLTNITPPSSGINTVVVKIKANCNAAGIANNWQTSLNGAAFVDQAGTSVVLNGTNGFTITITFADNGGNPAFVAGTYYYFQSPTSDISQTGAAIETPQALGQRVAGLQPLFGFTYDQFGNFVPPASPTLNAYAALALTSSQNVVIAFAVQSTTVNNAITIYVAGQGGAALTSAQIAAVQAFFNSFHMLTDVVTVASPTTRTITLALTGSITVKQALLASAQAALQSSLQTYLSGVDAAAPLGINGLVDYDYIVSLIRRTPGVTHVPAGGALTINTVAADLQLPVTPGAYEVAIWSQDVKTAFTWATV